MILITSEPDLFKNKQKQNILNPGISYLTDETEKRKIGGLLTGNLKNTSCMCKTQIICLFLD